MCCCMYNLPAGQNNVAARSHGLAVCIRCAASIGVAVCIIRGARRVARDAVCPLMDVSI